MTTGQVSGNRDKYVSPGAHAMVVPACARWAHRSSAAARRAWRTGRLTAHSSGCIDSGVPCLQPSATIARPFQPSLHSPDRQAYEPSWQALMTPAHTSRGGGQPVHDHRPSSLAQPYKLTCRSRGLQTSCCRDRYGNPPDGGHSGRGVAHNRKLEGSFTRRACPHSRQHAQRHAALVHLS